MKRSGTLPTAYPSRMEPQKPFLIFSSHDYVYTANSMFLHLFTGSGILCINHPLPAVMDKDVAHYITPTSSHHALKIVSSLFFLGFSMCYAHNSTEYVFFFTSYSISYLLPLTPYYKNILALPFTSFSTFGPPNIVIYILHCQSDNTYILFSIINM